MGLLFANSIIKEPEKHLKDGESFTGFFIDQSLSSIRILN